MTTTSFSQEGLEAHGSLRSLCVRGWGEGLTIGELCAGYGGLGLAVEQAFPGSRLAWFAEYDEAPSKILAHHWPDVPNLRDVTKVDWSAVEPVDIISGGTPCQDLSNAGARAGMTEGTRSNLWVQMREAIATIKPRYVVWENVRGAYSAAADSHVEQCPGCMGDSGDRGAALRALGRVLGDLSDLGYDAQWRGLRAADVGAAHGRYRVFVLATRRAGFGAAENPDGAGRGEGVHGSLGPGPAGSGTPALPDASDRGPGPVADADCAAGSLRGSAAAGEAPGGRARSDAGGHGGAPAQAVPDAVRSGDGGRSPEPGPEGRDVAALGSGEGGSAAGSVSVEWGIYEPAIRRWESIVGRPAPAPVEPGRKGGYRLSARFTEWLMGVPDGWIVDVPGVSRNEALKAAGNGVVPQQGAAALRDMLATEWEEVAA